MTVHKTIKEAEAVLKKERREFLKLCPVFKSFCKQERCHSYYSGEVRQNVETFIVYSPCCNSPLVTGHIEHDQE